jgi:hypothetical protein
MCARYTLTLEQARLAADENRGVVSFMDIKLAVQENVIPSDSALTQTPRQTNSQTRFDKRGCNAAAARRQC